jgi:hypothetical protein
MLLYREFQISNVLLRAYSLIIHEKSTQLYKQFFIKPSLKITLRSTTNAKPEAKVLSCFVLAKEYDGSQLVGCDTKENQRWRRASTSAAAKEMVLELSVSFIKRATKLDDSIFLDSEERECKRLRLS